MKKPPTVALEPPAPRPFLKWVGGKTQLLEQMRPLLPPLLSSPTPRARGTYFEPFVGGAALFFSLRPPRARLGDANSELVDCYCAVRDDVEAVITALQSHRYDPEHYYRVREQEPASLPVPARAARTIFLNKTGFNGLYRVNRSGQFNVPIGRYSAPRFCDPETLRACSAALAGVTIRRADFEATVAKARRGDFVYFDPPYVPVSKTSDFTAYVPGGFGWEEQTRLAQVFAALARRGVHVMLSNSDTPEVRKLYADFHVAKVLASRSVNSKSDGRGRVGEVVVHSYEPDRVVRSSL